jgi:hypothetical protein
MVMSVTRALPFWSAYFDTWEYAWNNRHTKVNYQPYKNNSSLS